jgi:hypothetical protein
MSLWSEPGFPHRGWSCIGVTDLKADDPDSELGTCEACGREQIRFVHTMRHPEWGDDVEAGCVCAEKLSEDYTGPREREKRLINRASRRARWLTRKWRRSNAGNLFLNSEGVNVGINPSRYGGYSWRMGGDFSKEAYDTVDEAKLKLFDALCEELGW